MFVNMFKMILSSEGEHVLVGKVCNSEVTARNEAVTENGAIYAFTLFKKRNGEWIELDLSKTNGEKHDKKAKSTDKCYANISLN